MILIYFFFYQFGTRRTNSFWVKVFIYTKNKLSCVFNQENHFFSLHLLTNLRWWSSHMHNLFRIFMWFLSFFLFYCNLFKYFKRKTQININKSWLHFSYVWCSRRLLIYTLVQCFFFKKIHFISYVWIFLLGLKLSYFVF